MLAGLPKKEVANAVTHALGLLFGLISIPFLLSKTAVVPIGAYVFSFSFLFMFAASTSYHLVQSATWKRRWQTVDHISIYFLIAGSYTPFLLGYLDPQKAEFILKLLWACVGLGTIFKIFFAGKFKIVSTLIYLAMGWASMFVLEDFMESMPSSMLLWLGIGGACYTIGTIFYIWKKFTYHHAIWHLFVLGGAITHLYAVWLLFE
jgi:hemolysin III